MSKDKFEAIETVAARDKDAPLDIVEQSRGEPNLELPIEDHKYAHEIRRMQQELTEAKELHDLRKGYASKLFWLIVVWLIIVMTMLFWSAISIVPLDQKKGILFHLSDSVMITFITSTTASVISLFAIAAKWLFERRPSVPKKRKE